MKEWRCSDCKECRFSGDDIIIKLCRCGCYMHVVGELELGDEE